MKKTLIALIPALVVQISLFLVPDSLGSKPATLWVAIAILVAGGVLSGKYVFDYLKKVKPDKSGFFYGFIATLVCVGYVVAFLFNGCHQAVYRGF
ncbi:MAG: hypothetical protein P1V20_07000 [Verrucomicrobiales bacterium]|nr:hypothetical protein [Verrucomicrobiales bacterium]